MLIYSKVKFLDSKNNISEMKKPQFQKSKLCHHGIISECCTNGKGSVNRKAVCWNGGKSFLLLT